MDSKLFAPAPPHCMKDFPDLATCGASGVPRVGNVWKEGSAILAVRRTLTGNRVAVS